jgi:hypothetical protein
VNGETMAVEICSGLETCQMNSTIGHIRSIERTLGIAAKKEPAQWRAESTPRRGMAEIAAGACVSARLSR